MRCKDWIAVASAGHARHGPDTPAGLMQVGHGKLAPLGRIARQVTGVAAALTLRLASAPGASRSQRPCAEPTVCSNLSS